MKRSTSPTFTGYAVPVTDNLPAPTPGFGDLANRPLRHQPTEALCFAVGYMAARPVHADQFGGFCAVAEELMARDAWLTVKLSLPPGMQRAIDMLYLAHRGQRTGARLAAERAARQRIKTGDDTNP